MSDPVDVAIVGGGLAGASLALALAPLGLRLALIETQAPPAAGAPHWDERCIGLNAASVRILEALGAWDALRPAASPIESTHISERGRFGVARFSAREAGLEALGYNTPLRAIAEVLWARAQALPAVRVLAPARVTGLRADAEQVSLQIDSATAPQALVARLAVAADGAHSGVRALLGIGAAHRDYGQSAIVTAVRLQRGLAGVAYERFLPSGPLALLPKPDDAQGPAASLVWSLPSARAQALMQLDEAAFLALAQEAFGERAGRFLALGRRSAHVLERVMAQRLTAPRVLLVSNAAQALHPVAAQGFNLGLRDVAVLAELLAGGGDPGATALLHAYERRRARDRERTVAFTDRLVRGFSNTLPGLAQLRHWGLFALNMPSPLKQAVMRQNLGYAGPVPRLARR